MTLNAVGDTTGDPADGGAERRAEELLAENAELRRRVDAAERSIAELRAEALARRSEVRRLAEELPLAMSRHALVKAMLRDVVHHPDKAGAVERAVRKLGRAPRKLVRMLRTARAS